LQLTFDGLRRPVALIDCGELVEHFPLVFPGWRIKDSPECKQSPILVIRREKSTYIVEADWLKQPIRRTDKVDAICALVAELVRAYVRNDDKLLCLHGAAAIFAGKLVVFPSQYRAGKSILSVCLAAKEVQLFCDDVLPISIADGCGIAPGLAPRLRLPLPDNLRPKSRNFVESGTNLEGKQYLYLDLDNDRLAARGKRAPVGAFVLLERVEGSRPTLEEISEAEVLHQVVWQNFAREAEAPQILDRLGRLVSSARRYRMHYDQAEDAVDLLKETFKDWPTLARQGSPVSAASTRNTAISPGAVPPDCYLRKPDISMVSVDGESFLADARGATIHHLNPVGSAIWTLLADPVTMADMTELLITAFPTVGRDQIQADMSTLIDTLMASNLLLVGPDRASVS